MWVVKNKFGQVSHEGKLNAQFHALPNLCDQLWKTD